MEERRPYLLVCAQRGLPRLVGPLSCYGLADLIKEEVLIRSTLYSVQPLSLLNSEVDLFYEKPLTWTGSGHEFYRKLRREPATVFDTHPVDYEVYKEEIDYSRRGVIKLPGTLTVGV